MTTAFKIIFLKCMVAPVVFGVALLAGAPEGIAQTASMPTATNSPANNPATEIIVTGSRIARPQTAASVPIAVVTAQNLEDKGITNISDEFRDLPIVGQSLTAANSNFQNSENGVALVNLRNLGSSRTLVLINGRRSVGIPGDSAVDLNNIPTDLIDHIEIATGGTSAVYGSDAVAGVVNIILKNNFTGLEFHAQNKFSDTGDAQNRLLSALGGTKFGGDKGHIVANFTYNKDNGLPSSNRSYSQNDSPQNSPYPPQGAFLAGSRIYTFDRNNSLIPFTSIAVNGFNRAQDRQLIVPVERYIGTVLGDYSVGLNIDFYTEFSYSKTFAQELIEPQLIDDARNPSEGVLPYNGNYLTNDTFPGISVANPFVPTALAASALAAGRNYIDFGRRSNDIFSRSNKDNREYYRGVIGIKGDLGWGFKYDLNYEFSKTHDHTQAGAILMNNYGAALNAVAGPNGPVCADPGEAAAGCVPINIFGFNTVSPAAANFLQTYNGVGDLVTGATPGEHVSYDLQQRVHQNVVSLNLTGLPIRLPGGPLGIATGAEFHSESSAALYDPFTLSGLSSAQLASDDVGHYNSKEGYIEISAPVMGNIPYIHNLTLEGAARYADYTTVGGVWSYKYGGHYAPTRDITFRAIYARAVRAPNIIELFSAPHLTAVTVVDPCDQGQGTGTYVPGTQLPAACLNIPGIANYLKTHPNFSYSLAQIGTIYGYLSGNPNLQAEATNTFTAGATVTPRFLPGFFMTVDYYTIKVNNAISSVDRQTSVSQCLLTGSPDFCSSVFRNANGFITQVNALAINAASYLVSGIDVQARYALKTNVLGDGSSINMGVYYNHKFKQRQTPFAGGPTSNEIGTADTYNQGQLGTGFKDQFTIDATFKTGPISIAYNMKYLGPVIANADMSGPLVHIPAYNYHDIRASVAVGDNRQYEFYVGCNNLFDKQPPFIASGNSQWPGTNTVADTYDLLGRMLFAGATVNF